MCPESGHRFAIRRAAPCAARGGTRALTRRHARRLDLQRGHTEHAASRGRGGRQINERERTAITSARIMVGCFSQSHNRHLEGGAIQHAVLQHARASTNRGVHGGLVDDPVPRPEEWRRRARRVVGMCLEMARADCCQWRRTSSGRARRAPSIRSTAARTLATRSSAWPGSNPAQSSASVSRPVCTRCRPPAHHAQPAQLRLASPQRAEHAEDTVVENEKTWRSDVRWPGQPVAQPFMQVRTLHCEVQREVAQVLLVAPRGPHVLHEGGGAAVSKCNGATTRNLPPPYQVVDVVVEHIVQQRYLSRRAGPVSARACAKPEQC